jgi:hypothetical protein
MSRWDGEEENFEMIKKRRNGNQGDEKKAGNSFLKKF